MSGIASPQVAYWRTDVISGAATMIWWRESERMISGRSNGNDDRNGSHSQGIARPHFSLQLTTHSMAPDVFQGFP